jgi:hypothetical protein
MRLLPIATALQKRTGVGAQIELVLEHQELAPARHGIDDRANVDPASILAAFFDSRRQQLAATRMVNRGAGEAAHHEVEQARGASLQRPEVRTTPGATAAGAGPAKATGPGVGKTRKVAGNAVDAVEDAAQMILAECLKGHEVRQSGESAQVALESIEVEGFRCFKDRVMLHFAEPGVIVITGRNEADAGALGYFFGLHLLFRLPYVSPNMPSGIYNELTI